MLDGRIDGGLAAGDPLECLVEFLGAGVLGQVAAGAGPQRVDDGAVISVGGEHEHLDVRVVFSEETGGLDAVAAGHAQVHQYDIWVLLGRQRQGLCAVGGQADDLDAFEQPQQSAESLADYALVVGEEHANGLGHAGTHSSTRNPLPVGPAVRAPPSSSARSLMPVSP